MPVIASSCYNESPKHGVWAGNPDSEVLHLIFAQTSPMVSLSHECFALIIPSLSGVFLLGVEPRALCMLSTYLPLRQTPPPKALSSDSVTHYSQQFQSWQRLRVSGFHLAFTNSFALILFYTWSGISLPNPTGNLQLLFWVLSLEETHSCKFLWQFKLFCFSFEKLRSKNFL